MKKSGITLLCLLLSAVAFASGSTGTALADSGFARAIRLLYERDGYAFTLTMENGVMQGDSFKVRPDQVVRSRDYVSRQDFIQYMSTEGSLAFTGASGRFRVYDNKKIVVYAIFAGESARNKFQEEELATVTQGTIDSILFTRATLLHKKASAGTVRYELGYPDGYPIRSLSLVFDRKADFISSITYDVDRPISGSRGTIVRQRISMSHYEHRVPVEADSLARLQSGQLRDYLTARYPRYKLQLLH